MKRIITISREFGSGGHSIGQKVSALCRTNFLYRLLSKASLRNLTIGLRLLFCLCCVKMEA